MSQLNHLDDWERKYIQNLPDYDLVAWSDTEAFHRYPNYNIVYNKLILSKHHTLIDTYDLEAGKRPTLYPCIIKPIVNLFGMSQGTYIASAEEEIEDTKGYMAQNLLLGKHYSTEFVIQNGKIIDEFNFLCNKNFYGSFILFESTKTMDRMHMLQVKNKVEELLKGFTGPICVEHINGNIFDFHLRPGVQFYDILEPMMSQYPKLMQGNYTPVPFKKCFSAVYRTRYNSIFNVKQIPQQKAQGVSSVQLCFTSGKPLSKEVQDEYSYRYMVVNGFDLIAVRNHGKYIRNNCLEINRL
jgi:hypothetical protein